MDSTLSCLCGANVVSFSGEAMLKFRCHCIDELRLTGVGFCNNILMSLPSLKVVKGMLKTFPRVAGSRNTITSHLCRDRGSLLYRASDGYPGTMAVKVGCIDDGDKANAEYVPDVEIFTRSRIPWIKAVEGAKWEVTDFTGLNAF